MKFYVESLKVSLFCWGVALWVVGVPIGLLWFSCVTSIPAWIRWTVGLMVFFLWSAPFAGANAGVGEK